MALSSFESDVVTLILYFVYLWFGLLALFIFSSCIIKSFYSFILFFAQYWLRCSISTEGMGLISVDRIEIVLWDVKAYIMIEGFGVSFFEPSANSFFRITVGKARVEYIHSTPSTPSDAVR